ncbi:MAG: hypothetical protein WC373_13725 [Smithella sp.]
MKKIISAFLIVLFAISFAHAGVMHGGVFGIDAYDPEFRTITGGAGGFTVDDDGDVIAKSIAIGTAYQGSTRAGIDAAITAGAKSIEMSGNITLVAHWDLSGFTGRFSTNGHTISGAYTFTAPDSFVGTANCFGSTLTVSGLTSSIKALPPEWFGAVGDCAIVGGVPTGTNDAAALQKTVDSLPYGVPILLTKSYLVEDTSINLLRGRITIKGTVGITNDGAYYSAPAIYGKNVDSIFVIGDGPTGTVGDLADFKFIDFNFYGGTTVNHAVNFRGSNDGMVFGAIFKKVYFYVFNGSALYTDNNTTVDSGYVLHGLKMDMCGGSGNGGIVETHANSYIVDVNIIRSSLHQNYKVINGAMRGYVNIEGNKLEGSYDETITIRATPAQYPSNVRLVGNYFEVNAGDYLVFVDHTGLSSSSFYADGNSYSGNPATGLPALSYRLHSVIDIDVKDFYYCFVSGYNLRFKHIDPDLKIVVDAALKYAGASFPATGAVVSPTNDELEWSARLPVAAKNSKLSTPYGTKYCNLATTGEVSYTISKTVEADEAIVATALIKYDLDKYNPTIGFYNAGGAALVTSVLTNYIGIGEWRLYSIIYTPASSTAVTTFRVKPYGASSGAGAYVSDVVAYQYKSTATFKRLLPWMIHTPLRLIATPATYDPPSIAAGASTTTTLTCTGAALGDAVDWLTFSLDLAGLTLTGYVSAADTLTAVLANNTAGAVDLASGTLAGEVIDVD